jgi:heterodisulfide reductase subunit B
MEDIFSFQEKGGTGSVKYAYYPGCSLHSTASEYDRSFREVCRKVGIELVEVKNWICCGTSPAHSVSRLLSLALPLKNLEFAWKMGYREMIAPCAACFFRFKVAIHEIAQDPSLKEKLCEITGSELREDIKVLHPLEIFGEIFPKPQVRSLISHDLGQLKVVCYYGCLLTRPAKVMQFDISEYPMSMDRLLGIIGVQALEWSYKTECCGSSFALTQTDAVLKLTRDILEEARSVGAEAVVVACPLCHANLDTRQGQIEERYGVGYRLPIFYFTQLLGLSMGISPKKLGLFKHFVDPGELLGKIRERKKDVA